MIFIDSLKTVVKGIDYGDDIILNERSKLVLIPEPNNPRDENAIIVSCRHESKDQNEYKKTGYLPRKLALHLIPFIKTIQDVAKFKVHVQILPPDKNSLADGHLNWYNIELYFYYIKDQCEIENQNNILKLKSLLNDLKKDKSNLI